MATFTLPPTPQELVYLARGVDRNRVLDVPAPGPARAAVYVRASSDEQARGYSLDGQVREVRAYCEAQGYRVVRLYKDVGSGRKLERDAFQTMIHHGLQGKFDTVVVWRRDRFGRDVVHNTVMERELRRAGV